jgi:UDP-N-acetylglucosamine 3-dehydrogenase
MPRKLRVAIVGCGSISELHALNWNKIQDIELAYAVDVVEERAVNMEQKFGAKAHMTDYNKLMGAPDIDIVDICVPTFLHPDVVVKAAEAGKNVFCEKPIALSLYDADRMIEACRRQGVKFMIGLPRRFRPAWLTLREIILSGALGRPIIWRIFEGASSGPHERWFNDANRGGGPFIDGFVHYYDFAIYTLGPVTEVFASAQRLKEDNTAIDSGTVLLTFASGDRMHLSTSWGLPGSNYKIAGAGIHDVFGTKGIISLPQEHKLGEVGHLTLMGAEERKFAFTGDSISDSFMLELSHFATCVREDKVPIVKGEDGRKALEVGLAVIESVKEDRPIALGK